MNLIRNTIRTMAVLGILIAPQIASACPTCKDGLHADGMAAAYAVSILFMMGMPFAIIAFWTVTIFRLRQKAALLAEANNGMAENSSNAIQTAAGN